MDWSDLLLRFIRAAGALASAFAGIAALLTDGAFPKRERPLTRWYKDLPFSDYRITRKGAILLAVILLAPAVQFVGDWIKDVGDANTQRRIALDIRKDVNQTVQRASEIQLDAEKKAIDQETAIGKQASTLLDKVDDQISQSVRISTDLNRSLNPLTDVRVTYWATVPFDAPELSEYRARLVEGIQQFLQSNDRRSKRRDIYVSMGFDDDPKEVAIPSQSSLMPKREEVMAYYLLRYSGLHFSFFRTHHAPTEFQALSARRPVPDLRFNVGTETGEKETLEYSLQYNLQSRTLRISAFQLPSDARYWTSNSTIAAVPDLSGVQLAIQIDDTMVPTLPKHGQLDETGQVLSRLRSQIQLGAVILQISTRKLWLNRHGEMTRLSGSDPRPFSLYSTVLPRSPDQLQLR